MLDVSTKTCVKCKVVKSVLDFHAHKGGKRNPRCKSCRAEDGRAYYKKNTDKFKAYKARAQNETLEEREARIKRRKDEAPAKRRIASWKWHIHKTLGVTAEQYEDMFAKQGGKCAICMSTEPGGKRIRFCIDHCHNTGSIRGLLCVSCNSGLGYFKDKKDRLSAAIAYLEKQYV